METITLEGQSVGFQWGRCLIYDTHANVARWAWPVDAREGLSRGTMSGTIPPGTPVPPHPEPMAKQPGPIVPAVQVAAGTVALSAPSQDIGATSVGPRVVRTAAAAGPAREVARPSAAPSPDAGGGGS